MGIDREPWHTSRRENKRDYEQSKTPYRWARIVDAIVEYQNKHRGMSPTDQMIARETGLSLAQVQYHMREMVNAKMLSILRSWPRVIAVHEIVKPAKSTAPQQGGEVEMSQTQSKRRVRQQPFIVRAKQVAKVIEDHWQRYNGPPTVSHVESIVYGNDVHKPTGAASRTINKMVENGWVEHTPRYTDYRVTEAGRRTLFDTRIDGEPQPPAMVQAVQKRERKKALSRKGFIARAHDVAKVIVDIVDRTGQPAAVREIHEAVYGSAEGRAVAATSRVLRKMTEEGWVKHKPGYRKDVLLTGAGRAALFNDIPEDVPTDMPVHRRDKEWPVQLEQHRFRKPPGATIPRDVDSHAVPPRMRAARDEGDFLDRAPQQTEGFAFTPDKPATEAPVPAASTLSDLDLILELNKRGYKVSR